MLRPCRMCGVLSHKARCKDCTSKQEAQRPTPTERGYDATHRRLAKQCIKSNPRCVKCGSTEDLTANHIQALKDGGLNVEWNYETMCRSCNSGLR